MNIDDIILKAKEIMKDEGEHKPLVVSTINNKLALFPLTFEDDDEKEEMRVALREFIREHKLKKYWTIMEGWYSSNIHVSSPKRDVNRKEALIIGEFSEDNPKGVSVMIPFTKKEGKIIFGKEERTNDFTSKWNFFMEEIPKDELDYIHEKKRREDIVKRIEKANITKEYEKIITKFKKDHPEEKTPTYEEFKKVLITMAEKGIIGFNNGRIPDVFKSKEDDE